MAVCCQGLRLWAVSQDRAYAAAHQQLALWHALLHGARGPPPGAPLDGRRLARIWCAARRCPAIACLQRARLVHLRLCLVQPSTACDGSCWDVAPRTPVHVWRMREWSVNCCSASTASAMLVRVSCMCVHITCLDCARAPSRERAAVRRQSVQRGAGVMMWEVFHCCPPYTRGRGGKWQLRPEFPRFPADCPLSFALLAVSCIAHEPQRRPNFWQVCSVLEDLQRFLRGRGSARTSMAHSTLSQMQPPAQAPLAQARASRTELRREPCSVTGAAQAHATQPAAGHAASLQADHAPMFPLPHAQCSSAQSPAAAEASVKSVQDLVAHASGPQPATVPAARAARDAQARLTLSLWLHQHCKPACSCCAPCAPHGRAQLQCDSVSCHRAT